MANIETALTAIANYHFGQVDKGGRPYVQHLLDVANIVVKKYSLFFNKTEESEIFQVALLHDILEDTACTADRLRQAGFEEAVVSAVEILTKKDGISKTDYLTGIVENKYANVVKLADLENNLDLERLNRKLVSSDLTRINEYLRTKDVLEHALMAYTVHWYSGGRKPQDRDC